MSYDRNEMIENGFDSETQPEEEELEYGTLEEGMVDSVLSFDGEEIVFHGPNCMVLADSENYSKKDLRNYLKNFKDNLESVIFNAIETYEAKPSEEEEEEANDWVATLTPNT